MRKIGRTRAARTLFALIVTLGWAATGLPQERRHAREFFAIQNPLVSVEINPSLFSHRFDPARGVRDLPSVYGSQVTPLPDARIDADASVEDARVDTGHQLSWRRDDGDTFFKSMGVAMFVSSAGDFVSTELVLSKSGIVEFNPVQSHQGVRLASHIAVPAFVYWASERLRRRGKDKWALVLRISFNVAYSYVTVHNVRNYLQ